MNSAKFYSKEDLETINKKKRETILISFFVFLIFVVAVTLFFVYSNFDTKTFYAIACTVVSIIATFLIVFLSFKIVDLKHIYKHFYTISVQQEKKVCFKFLLKSKNPITIDRYTKAFQLEVKIGEEIKTLYLNALYSYDFVSEHEYEVILAADYVKEICNEL